MTGEITSSLNTAFFYINNSSDIPYKMLSVATSKDGDIIHQCVNPLNKTHGHIIMECRDNKINILPPKTQEAQVAANIIALFLNGFARINYCRDIK